MPLFEHYDPLPVVDAHHHIWDLEGDLTYPWLSNNKHSYQGDNTALRRTYLPAEYRRDSALHNVVGTVFVEAEARRDLQVQETEWVTAQAAEHGFPNAIVAHAWVDEPNSKRSLRGRRPSRWCAASARSLSLRTGRMTV